MKKILFSALVASPGLLAAQSAVDAMRFSPTDIRGTARFTAMGGAFTALGGDISSISQNPAGIGVYRSQDVNFTLDLDAQHSRTGAGSFANGTNQTKFLLNNLGAVFTFNISSEAVPNFNIGFSFNKSASFNRSYQGTIPGLRNSMSNYIAGLSNSNGVSDADLQDKHFDAYNSYMPWLSVLGYDGYLIYPTGNGDIPHWVGQWADGTSGRGYFGSDESGAIDEYNIALGGNIYDVVYWGMDFGITNFSYTLNSYWQEDMQGAMIDANFLDQNVHLGDQLVPGPAQWRLNNWYHAHGTGFNYKLGLIFKPIQELRIGMAFHTPTWTPMTEEYGATLQTRYGTETRFSTEETNGGANGYNQYNFRSPWRFTFGLAGVIGNRFIISADYECTSYTTMKFSDYDDYIGSYEPDYGWDDWGWRPAADNGAQATRSSGFAPNDPFYKTNDEIKEYYKSSSTLRLGAEFRVTPRFSVRAGYAFTSSPVREKLKNNQLDVYTAGTIPQFNTDDTTNYFSAGLGYRHKALYIDLAYQYKSRKATYHAYTPSPGTGIPSPESELRLDNNNVVMTMGFRF